MAELFLLSYTVESLLQKSFSLACQEVRLAWGVKSDLKKLKNSLSSIKAVLLDAEKQQDTTYLISTWLGQLKDVLYDAEDLLDEFECEDLRRQVVKSRSTCRKVRRFFSSSNPLAFRLQMVHSIKEIRERLDDIAADKNKFHPPVIVNNSRDVTRNKREMTQSNVDASNVFGRDDDKEKIIKLLDNGGSTNLSVIPIVGMAGIGKTELAKFVYGDKWVIENFKFRMWACVAENFDLKEVMRKIIMSATDETCSRDLGPDQLQTRLRNNLEGRKFLLVLDDVWNEDKSKWDELRDLLKVGANGSKIIVTTRSSSVASNVGTIPAHNLGRLSHEDCVSLFKKLAFAEGQENYFPRLFKIGNEIVTKCEGNPLAVKTLGGLLFSKTDEHDWLFVKDNELWTLEHNENGILPALRLSYDVMPSHLKPCFVYCSIFPKGYEYDSRGIIRLWMALGLIQSSNENEALEDVGLRYFKELWSRSFFQDVVELPFFFLFKMDNLFHALGLSILQNEYSIVKSRTQSTSENVRHLSFSNTDLSSQEVPEFMNKLDKLRTIRFQYEGAVSISRSFVNACILKFKYLRVLDLHHSSFEVLPNSIGTLKQLRYFNLSGNHRIKKLPNSICKLQNLQTLRLIDCDEFEKLPRNIRNMISLRSLEITTKQKRLPQNGIGCLNSLQHLYFYRCCNLEYLFEGMQHLTSLRTLVIVSCTSLTSLSLCSIKYLTTLENLEIEDCEELNLMEEEDNEGLEGLRLSLRCLVILELPQLETLPEWLQRSVETLQYLEIDGCPNFLTIPEWLTNFRSLQKLRITRCPNLLSLPVEIADVVKELHVEDFPALSERRQQGMGKGINVDHVPEISVDIPAKLFFFFFLLFMLYLFRT